MISRFAIATADGVSVADHLARSAAFVVLEAEDGRIVARSVRNRETGECGNHKSFVQMLEGCDAVICGGIGQGAFDSLAAHGIRSIVTAGPHSIDDAAARHLEGALATTNERVCLCH
jgi:predicted Fe-Mo cluster-binding NifX family protein